MTRPHEKMPPTADGYITVSCRARLWERGGRGKEATVAAAGRYRPALEHSVKRGLVVSLTSLILVGPSAAQPAPPAVGVVRARDSRWRPP
jgi:hypothetical protein